MIGQGGVEWTYDRWLRGRDGVAKLEVDAFGRPKSHDPVPGGRLAEPGDTLVTTIDAKVQAKAEEALRYGIDLAHTGGAYRAAGGAAVVLDARNGEVLAMASYPTFDPAVWVGGISTKDYKQLADPQANHPLLNRAIQEQKAVGSTFKVVDAIAGLEEGVINPGTGFFCDGSFKVPIATDETVWNCWLPDGHGTLDLVGAITQSCDVYFYNVGYLFYQPQGHRARGLGRPPRHGQAHGHRHPRRGGRARADAGLASCVLRDRDRQDLDAGQLGQPGHRPGRPGGDAAAARRDLRGDRQRRLHRAPAPRLEDRRRAGQDRARPRPGQAEASSTSRRARSTSCVAGCARRPRRPPAPLGRVRRLPVPVAGKTGTAEVFGSGDYAWYASYAPADDPRYVVVVMVEQGGHGGSVAAPATRLIYDALFGIKSGKRHRRRAERLSRGLARLPAAPRLHLLLATTSA